MTVKENINFFQSIQGSKNPNKYQDFVSFAQEFNVIISETLVNQISETTIKKILLLLAIFDTPNILILQDPFSEHNKFGYEFQSKINEY